MCVRPEGSVRLQLIDVVRLRPSQIQLIEIDGRASAHRPAWVHWFFPSRHVAHRDRDEARLVAVVARPVHDAQIPPPREAQRVDGFLDVDLIDRRAAEAVGGVRRGGPRGGSELRDAAARELEDLDDRGVRSRALRPPPQAGRGPRRAARGHRRVRRIVDLGEPLDGPRFTPSLGLQAPFKQRIVLFDILIALAAAQRAVDHDAFLEPRQQSLGIGHTVVPSGDRNAVGDNRSLQSRDDFACDLGGCKEHGRFPVVEDEAKAESESNNCLLIGVGTRFSYAYVYGIDTLSFDTLGIGGGFDEIALALGRAKGARDKRTKTKSTPVLWEIDELDRRERERHARVAQGAAHRAQPTGPSSLGTG